MSFRVSPSHKISGVIEVPGDKSISHRALILGAIASGKTVIENLLEAEDVFRTVEILRELGVSVRKRGGRWVVEGRGLHGLSAPERVLDCGNSGTTLRLMTGLLAAFPFTSSLTGDRSLARRPMGRLISPLTKMGARIREFREREERRVVVAGGGLRGGTFRLPVASAQLKSALLLAGLYTDRGVTVIEPETSRDHTERMLAALGARIRRGAHRVTVRPVSGLKARRIRIPGDFSSAAFFLVAGLTHPNPKSRLILKGVGVNPTRTGALDVLKRMGGRIRIRNRRVVSGEPVADLEVCPSVLRGVTIRGAIIARLIDEIPILSVAGCLASGVTQIRDAAELRVKESDRIAALVSELRRFGVRIREYRDGLAVFGGGGGKPLRGAFVTSHGDHRIAMALAILGSVTPGETRIEGTEVIDTSFPEFLPLLRKVGVPLTV